MENKKNITPPLFFSEKDRFISSLPPQCLSGLQPAENHKYTHTTDSDDHKTLNKYIHDYLNYYRLPLGDINNEKKKDKNTIAKNHFMWKTTFSILEKNDNALSSNTTNYTIVQQYWQANHTTKKTLPNSGAEKETSKGTIVIVHGYLDHTGLYGNVIQWALMQGYDVLSFDLPGHGLSSGAPALINSFDIYSKILYKVIKSTPTTLTQPLIALGQSTGCAVICHALLNQDPLEQETTSQLFSQAILLAPLVRSHHWRWLRYLYFLLRPSISSIQRKFIGSSHNNNFNHFIKYSDPLQASRLPLVWLGAMEQWYQHITHTTHTCSLPLTIIQGTGDTTVDWRYNIPALNQLFTHSQTHYIKNAQHHLANESPEYWQTVEELLTQCTQNL